MKTFMLIGVFNRLPRCICTVTAENVGAAAHKLRGASYPGVLRGVSVSSVIGTAASDYAIFRPGRDTGTVLEPAIAKLDANLGNGVAFGDYLNRYTDWLLVEVAAIN